MRNPKLFPVVCVVAFCASLITIRAEDTSAQAAARAALMEKINESEAQPAQPAPAPPIVVTPSGAAPEKPSQPTNATAVPAPAVSAPPAVPAPKAKVTPAPETIPTTPAPPGAKAQTKVQAASEQKTTGLNQQNRATPAVVPAAPPAPRARPVAIRPVKPASPAARPEVMSPPDQINANSPGSELGLKPIHAPPLPISAAKEMRLQGLLQLYEADQITPAQYHAERAKILAEP
jgi:hypothetical protein